MRITPYTSERELQRIIAKSYAHQAWSCITGALMIWLAIFTATYDGVSPLSVLVSLPAVSAVYFSFRVFHSSERVRTTTRSLIALRREMERHRTPS